MLRNDPPAVTMDGRYPIGKAAELLGVNRSTLRRYLDKDLIKCKYQKATHRKIFTGRQLLALWEANA